MHEKQHQRGFLFRSQLEGEEDPGGSSMEQSWGPGDESLEAGPEERVQPRTSDEHDSGPQVAEVAMRVGVMDRGAGWNSLTVATTGPQGSTRPLGQRAPSSLDGKAQSHRGGPLAPGW